MQKTSKTAIIGSGNIATDPMINSLRHGRLGVATCATGADRSGMADGGGDHAQG
jgi:acetaldehyde dehydrogenase (acetylating)